MSAIRLARGFTGREAIVKFEGCYHGHSDSLADQGRLRRADLRRADFAGRAAGPRQTHGDARLQRCRSGSSTAFRQIGGQVACVIVEPVAGNMSCVPPAPGFLEACVGECDAARRAADFRRSDDRISRRPRRRAATVRDSAGPDDARQDHRRRHAGRRIRRPPRHHVDSSRRSDRSIRQARLSGNPVSMAAGLATLRLVSAPGFHQRLRATTDRSVHGLRGAAARAGIDVRDEPRMRHVRHVLHAGADRRQLR